MNFVMNHAPSAGSIPRPVDQQSMQRATTVRTTMPPTYAKTITRELDDNADEENKSADLGYRERITYIYHLVDPSPNKNFNVGKYAE